jgi:hypothetical protein
LADAAFSGAAAALDFADFVLADVGMARMWAVAAHESMRR